MAQPPSVPIIGFDREGKHHEALEMSFRCQTDAAALNVPHLSEKLKAIDASQELVKPLAS